MRPSQPGLRPSQPGPRPSQPGLRPSQPASQTSGSGLAGWASGLAGWPRGGMDGRTNEQTNGKSPHSTGLHPLSGPLPKILCEVEEWQKGGCLLEHGPLIGTIRYKSPQLKCQSTIHPKIIDDSFLGSGPDRGRSPVEWGDFPSVRPFVRPYVPPSGPASLA